MKKQYVVIALMSFFVCLLFGQYNEKEIITQQAYQLLSQRQYAQAEQLYLQVLDKYPNDLTSISQLLMIYFALMQTDKAEALLTNYQRVMPSQIYSEQHIQLLVMQAKVSEAWQESMAYLELFNHEEIRYRQIASYFERKGFYDKVLDLYQMARIRLNKPAFFRLEIANASLNYRLFEQAIREYLAYLETSPVSLFFTNNQIKTILEEDSTLINVIAAIADSSSSAVLKEAYAGALLSRKDYYGALNVYKKLDLAKLYRFADDHAASGNDSLAYMAYEYAQSQEKDQLKKAEASYRMALISYQRADYPTTRALIQANLSLPLWQERYIYINSSFAVALRKLMAETCLATGAGADSAIVWLEEAKKFAKDAMGRQETDLEIAKLRILEGDTTSAENILSTIKEPKLSEKKDYLSFLGALLSNQTALADTLMNNFIIRYPQSTYTNDAIYLVMLTLGMQPRDLPMFFSAIKLLQMNQKSGIDSLEAVFLHNGDEELLLLAIEWAIGLGAPERALVLMNYSFTDPVAQEYTELIKLMLVRDKSEEQRIAREFLKSKPNSIFSPDFRQRISRWSASRPNL